MQPAPGPERPPAPGGFVPPPAGSFGQAVRPPAQPSGEAIGSLVCGAMAWTCFPLGFVAIWLGAKARRLAREDPERFGGEGLALAGMWVGGVLASAQLLFWILYFGFFAAMFGAGLASP